MRILLVHARFPATYWSFQYALPITGKKATMPPLGLATVAAHLPADWELRLVDMNIEALDDADLRWADAVLVGGMLVQADSMREVIDRAAALGVRTVAGGPAPSAVPDQFDTADVVFGGEVEGRSAELVAAITAPGRVRVPMDRDALPDITRSPLPRVDLYKADAYMSMNLQYSRGCPFHCEFCDVVQLFGNRPRVKQPSQVIAELEALLAQGWHGSVFVVDDNFVGNMKEVKRLLPELTAWQEAHGFPFELYTEASLNLARDPALVAGMVAAGFTSVFLGIETPSTAALAQVGKMQNLRLDINDAIDRLSRAGLEVMAGFIVGFDSDGPEAFAAQLEFLADAPIPFAMLGILHALPDTAMWRRLAREGRLRGLGTAGDPFGRPNFDPTMDERTLLAGYADLLARIYTPEAYLRRCLAYLERTPAGGTAGTHVHFDRVRMLHRAIWQVGVRSPRRGHFWKLIAAALRRSPRHFAWAVAHAVQSEHFFRYTTEDVLPRIRAAIAEVDRERARAAATDDAAAPVRLTA